MDKSRSPRHLGILLLLGILTLPIVFCWFVLQRGYDRSLRQTVFAYSAIMTVVPMLGRLF